MFQESNILVYDAWYPVDLRRRYTEECPHKVLHDIFIHNKNMISSLNCINNYTDMFKKIPLDQVDTVQPFWNNGYLPYLDSMSIYAFLAERNPFHYYEIGSGNSTKFARRTIIDNKLKTKIVSIDPCPRAEVEGLCDVSVRAGIECMDLSIFDGIKQGDIIFFDGSHRIFQNSDCVVFFCELLPLLKEKDVLIGIHDIFLPYDYHEHSIKRYYNEQYIVASIILFSQKFEVILPSYFASCQYETSKIMNLNTLHPDMGKINGCTMWMCTTGK